MRSWGLGCLILLLLGCTERARINPFDPIHQGQENPFGVLVLAGDRQVLLSWSDGLFTDLAEFRIDRIRPASGDTASWAVEASQRQWSDNALTNRVALIYRFRGVLDNGSEVGLVDSLWATPGPEVCWVADTGAGRLQQLAPDGRARRLTVSGFNEPTSVSVTPGGVVWVADLFRRRVVAYNRNGEQVAENRDAIDLPRAVKAAPDGSVWVADESGAVVHIGQSGETLSVWGEFDRPADVGLHEASGSVWVLERDLGSVLLFESTGERLGGIEGLGELGQLDVVQSDGSVWVSDTSRGCVERYDAEGRLLHFVALTRPFGVSYDAARQLLWVGDFDLGTVERVDLVRGERTSSPGILGPLGIAHNPVDGSVWIAARLSDAVVKLDVSGREIARLEAFRQPFDLALDLGISVRQ